MKKETPPQTPEKDAKETSSQTSEKDAFPERRERLRSRAESRFKSRNAVFLLPNAFTTAALFAGFYAILQSISGDWQQASLAVVAAALLDACDGRIARWTGTQSSFGEEYDSLSDVISFGVAPALIAYQWGLAEMGKAGLGVTFCYCAATAMRLARFNSKIGGVDRRFFIGMPSPAAAVWAVSYVATMDAWGFEGESVRWLTCAVFALAAMTMVTGFRYYSFKEVNIRRQRVPFRYVALFFVIVAMLYALAETLMEVLLVVLSLYFVSGYVLAFRRFFPRRRPADTDDNPPAGD